MKKGKKRTTLVDIRRLLLRTAILVALVGLGGVWMKKGASAQTASSIVWTSPKTEGPDCVKEERNHSDLVTDFTGNPVEGGLPLALAAAQAR